MDLPKKTHLLLFFPLLAFLGFVRFFRLSSMGISVNDAVVYITLAHQWLDHNFTIGANKLGYHLLCFLASHLIGIYDDTVLYLNSALDLTGICLLYLLALKMRMNRFLALSVVVVYGCLPTILFENTRGLPHLPTMTFVVGSVLAFHAYTRSVRWQRPFIFLCGILAGFSAAVHPTALALVLVYPVVIVWARCLPGFCKKSAFAALLDVVVYSAAVTAVAASMVGILTISSHDFVKSAVNIVRGLSNHHAAGTQGEGGDFLRRTLALGGLFRQMFTVPVLLLLSCAAGLGLWSYRFRNDGSSRDTAGMKFAGMVWAIAAGYVAVNVFADKAIQTRLLVPMIPLAVLGGYALLDLGGLCRRVRWLAPLVLAVSVLLSAWNVAAHREYVTKPTTVIRQMGNVLADRIGPEDRALLLPSQFDLSMLETLYLDARWLYRLREPWVPSIKLLAVYRIRYVIICKNLNRGIYDEATPADLAMKDLETNLMMRWLAQVKARMIYRGPGDELLIFELDYPRLTGPSPILTPRRLKFYNSQQADYIGPRFHRLTRIRKNPLFGQKPSAPAPTGGPGV